MMRRLLRPILGLALCSWLLWLAVPVCPAQDAVASAHRRLIYRFDFEEREKGNFEELPMHWYAIGRPANTPDPNFSRQRLHEELVSDRSFTAHSKVSFDTQYQTSGKHSFHLGLDGGNAGAFLEVGTLPAVPNSDYLVTAMVRTSPLSHANAHLVAYFVDANGQRIESSVSDSGPIRTNQQWQSVSVRLVGDFPNAVWICLQIELLQPQRDSQSPLGDRQVIYHDVRGGAWFDDITLWQLPRVTVETQNRVNVIRAPERPRLAIDVRDLTGQTLMADVTVYDYDLQPVDRTAQGVGGGSPTSFRWTPALPRLGWYLVDLNVRDPAGAGSSHGPVARALNAFLWMPEDDTTLPPGQSDRFVVDAQNLTDEQLNLLPALLDQVGLDSVTLSCWSRYTTRANLDQRQAMLDQVIGQLLTRGRQISLSLDPLPGELATSADVDPHNPLSLFTDSRKNWTPYLAPIVMRHGQRVRRWQMGSTDYPFAFFQPDLAPLMASVNRDLHNLAPQPRLVLPWRLDQERRTEIGSAYPFALDVPPAVAPQYMAQYLTDWLADPPATVHLHLREPPATLMSQRNRVDDLVLRMLHGWEARAYGLALSRPWTTAAEHRTMLLPDPLLGAFANVAHRLADRQVISRLPLATGLECMIFSKTGPPATHPGAATTTGMLAAWNRSASPEDSILDIYLGVAPRVIDVWGNRAQVPLVNGRHRWPLTQTPVFFENIDPALALFRARFRVEPAFIESLQIPHQRSIVLTNPWSRTISGSMSILEPQEWSIEPRRTFFSIASGQSTTLPFEIMFPVSEIAGRKRLVARFDFMADQHYVVDLSADLELGLRDVDFDASLAVEPGPKGTSDAVVTQMITNTGSKVLAVYAFANFPGFPRQERLVAGLMPGQSTVRRFRFTDGGPKLQENTVRVGVRETSGPAVLNKVLTVRQTPAKDQK